MTAILDERQFSYEYARQSAIALVQRDHRAEQMQHLLEQRPRGHRRERISHNPAHIFAEEQHQQVLFGARVEEQCPGADIGSAGDFASSGGLETLAAEQFSRGTFDPLELVALAAFDPARDSRSALSSRMSVLSFERAQLLLKIRPICQTLHDISDSTYLRSCAALINLRSIGGQIMAGLVLREDRDGLATLTLNRPEKLELAQPRDVRRIARPR